MAYWTVGKKVDSDTYVSIGPFISRMKAEQAADKLEEGQVFDIKSRNRNEVQRELKARLFMEAPTQNLAGKIISRFRRKKTDPEPEEQTLEV